MEATALPAPAPRNRALLALTGLLYLTRLVGSCLVALPIATALRATGVGHQPTGDGVLFAPGGTYLVETLRLAAPSLSSAVPTSIALLVIATLLQLLPQGALIHGLTQPTLPLSQAVQGAISSFPRLLLLGGLGVLAQACTLILGVVAAQLARTAVGGPGPAWSGELAFVLVLGLSLLLVCAVGVWVDLARCAHAWGVTSLGRCCTAAMGVLLERPLRVLGAGLFPVLALLLLTVGTGFIAGALKVELGGSWRWLTVLVLHQLVIVIVCAAETQWLARASRYTQAQRNPRRRSDATSAE